MLKTVILVLTIIILVHVLAYVAEHGLCFEKGC